MKLYKQMVIIASLFCLSAAGCGDMPLLSELETNRLVVVIKGTYESNSPQPWNIPVLRANDPLVEDDSVVIVQSPAGDVFPSAFMLDVSELRLLDVKGHQQKFSNIRQTFAMGLSDGEPFFSGTGVILENNDVPTTQYPALLIYVRKMLFDGAIKWLPQSTWSPLTYLDTFTERPVPGFNFNQFQAYSIYDPLRYESYLYNRVFPIIIGLEDTPVGMIFNKKYPYTVLEIRFVVKNFIKKFEVENKNNNIFGYIHYYGFSDWLQDVQPDETTIGGNLHTVARSYVPGLAGSIRGTNNGVAAHVIAIPNAASIANYTIPAPGNLRQANPCNMPRAPGQYLGKEISAYLDYLLRLEKFKYDWNQKFPTSWSNNPPPDPDCASFDGSSAAGGTGATTPAFTAEWDEYAGEVGGFKIPQLAVWVEAGQSYSIENVMPGSYDLYISSGAPTYGQLYTDGAFTPYANNPVTVSIGGAGKDPLNNTSINFP